MSVAVKMLGSFKTFLTFKAKCISGMGYWPGCYVRSDVGLLASLLARLGGQSS